MSLYPILWAAEHAPVYDAEERAILVSLVMKCDFDGMNAFRSQTTLGQAARVNKKTAERKLLAMERRGLLRRQTKYRSKAWHKIPQGQRPVVWEVMIPAQWWSAVQLEDINEQRAGLGRPPLTPENRPPIAPAPLKPVRADKGKPRPKKRAEPSGAQAGGGTTSPGSKTDISTPGGGTTSPPPRDYKSPPPGLQVPLPSETPSETPSEKDETASRPSVRAGGGVREAQPPAAGTDGRGGDAEQDQEDGPVPAGDGPGVVTGATVTADSVPEEKTAAAAGGGPAGGVVRVDSPGVRLLMSAADDKTLADLLRGTAMRDQGLMCDGLLEAGHSPEAIRAVIAMPMPATITTSRSAVVSGRLRKLSGLVPARAAVPHQTSGPDSPAGEGYRWEDAPTPTAPAWADVVQEREQLRQGVERLVGCEGDGGLCPTLAVVGETRCARHLDWPLCPGTPEYTCTARTRTGAQCETCAHQAYYLARLDDDQDVPPRPASEPEPEGTCTGHSEPCGRPVVAEGLCARCRIAAQRDRDRIDAEFRAARDAAVAAVAAVAAQEAQESQEAHETHQAASAPF